MSISSEYILRQQERDMEIWKLEQALKEGKTVAVPNRTTMASIQHQGDIPTISSRYDEIRYNYNSMTYETRSQSLKIQELEKQLEQEQMKKLVDEETEKQKLSNLIAYYYNR